MYRTPNQFLLEQNRVDRAYWSGVSTGLTMGCLFSAVVVLVVMLIYGI